MSKRTRLLLVIPHLGGGGAEQVVALLARHLDPKHFETHLCLITNESFGQQAIPRWVQLHRLHRKRVRYACWQLIRLIHIEQPEVILSGMAHLNFLILLLRPFLPRRTRILVRQNTTVSSVARTVLARLLYRWLYPRADVVICQSQAMAADLTANFAIPESKLAVLANPIETATIRAACTCNESSSSTSAWPRLLAVSRLSHEKGLDLLLQAMPEVRRRYPHLHLNIFGTGPEEAALKKLAVQLNLNTAVTFSGYTADIIAAYAEATLFALPSRYEGLPNALLEAAAAGLPLVATPCSAGVSDLLHDAPGTWFTSAISAEFLAETILAALAALPAPPERPIRFNHAFVAPFEVGAAIAAYTTLLQSFAQAPAR